MTACRIVLAPVKQDGRIDALDVTMRFSGLTGTVGATLLRAQVNTVSIPCADPQALTLTDTRGDVPFALEAVEEYPVRYSDIRPLREPEGEIAVRYTLRPHVLKDTDICGPYFDFRAEDGGANASGLALLLDCPGFEGAISLSWDMRRCSGGKGVCTWGEGDVAFDGPLDRLRDSYFMFGDVHSETEGEFGFYWLGTPAFRVDTLAVYTRRLFGVMQAFFHDDEPVYRVFLRHDPFKTSGGTALRRSYMFGWNDTQPVSVDEKQNLLAHEMVHNWPQLNDRPYGTTTWYAEGTAEYYSIMLPLRAGLITKAQALAEVQRRTDAYYTNPTRRLSDMDAAKVCWQDRRAQRLAYGRGIFFLAAVDARIRRATGGQKRIDDVVLDLLDQDRRGVTLGNEVFLATVRRIAGIDVTDAWRVMHEGGHFAPDPDSFDVLFNVGEVPAREADTGAAAVSYRWSLR